MDENLGEVKETVEVEVEDKVKSNKLSYDQLEQVARQAIQQAEQFAMQLNQAKNEALYVRLDFLFKVCENSRVFDTDFVVKCSNEIESLIYPTDNQVNQEDNK